MRWAIPPPTASIALGSIGRPDSRWYNFFNEMQYLGYVPVGGLIPWAKSFGSGAVPALPVGWVECDGSTISDSLSPLDGATLPDLNGDNAFLRGNSTSGGTGAVASGAGENYYEIVWIMRIR